MKQFILLFALIALTLASTSKISDSVIETLREKGKADVIIRFTPTTIDFSKLTDAQGKKFDDFDTEGRAKLILEKLTYLAGLSSESMAAFKSGGFQILLTANAIAINELTEAQINECAENIHVARISSNAPKGKRVLWDYFGADYFAAPDSNVLATPTLPQHITATGANLLWAKGFKGKGITIGVLGTGVNHLHTALVRRYRGNNGDGTFTHDRNWLQTDVFGPTLVPNDGPNVATHLTGSMVGDEQNIGMAPKAKFISCKGVTDTQLDTSSAVIACLDFFLAPTKLDGSKPKTKKRPDIVYMLPCESCDEADILQESINALIASGIVVVTSSGVVVPGGNCAGVARPPAIYPTVFTVGGLDLTNTAIESTTASGPPSIDGVEDVTRLKPDATAPGFDIISSVFINQTGESLFFPAAGAASAAAISAGGIALLWTAVPTLRRKIPETLDVLRRTATPIASLGCQSTQSDPNQVFGHGSLNFFEAAKVAQKEAFKACRQCKKSCVRLFCERWQRRRRRKCIKQCRKGPLCKPLKGLCKLY